MQAVKTVKQQKRNGAKAYGTAKLTSRRLEYMDSKTVHVFIVASKGILAKYGGFETFVENLTAGKQNEAIQYHVSCMGNEEKHFVYNGADCFNVKQPVKGAPGRILHGQTYNVQEAGGY